MPMAVPDEKKKNNTLGRCLGLLQIQNGQEKVVCELILSAAEAWHSLQDRQYLTPWPAATCAVGKEEVNVVLQFSNFQTLLSNDLRSQDHAVD
jgi:hypothetical protein